MFYYLHLSIAFRKKYFETRNIKALIYIFNMSDTYTYLGYISLMSPFNSSPEKLEYIQERRKLYDNGD